MRSPNQARTQRVGAVDIAENGDVALKKLQRATKHGKSGYDLVLTDVFMPKVRAIYSDLRTRLSASR